ncbi:MAG TPA: branched-chain amino acid ABC transporter permease [Acetobacteraceae bacterium]|nr:branched-chain amino acid ABC transporter permease [Acetobacteraceae bacterium]
MRDVAASAIAQQARTRQIRRIVLDCTVATVVVVLMGGLRFVYSNELMLFNFIAFLALAQGLNIIYGFTGYLPFGYVGFYGAGAYGFALAVMHLHAPALLGMVAAGLAALVLAVVLLPLLRLSGAYFAIASMAAAQAVYEVVANPSLEDITKGPYGVSLSQVFAPAFSYYIALAILAVTLGLVVWLRNSRFGLSLQAIRDDNVSAAMAGISVVRGRTIAWLLSALVAGLVGGVFAWHVSVFYPDTAFDLSVAIFSTVFLLFGGATTLSGPLLGVFILYGTYNVIGLTVPQYFQFTYGTLIVLLVLFLPNGLVSLLTSRGIRVP